MFTLAHFYGTRFPFQHVSSFGQWDSQPVGALKLSGNFQCDGALLAVTRAVSWESEAKALVLDSFCPNSLNHVLEELFSHSLFLTRLSLDNYKEPPADVFKLEGCSNSKLSELAFRNCQVNMIFALLNGMKRFEKALETLTLSRCTFSKEEFSDLFDMITKTNCLQPIRSLRLEDGTLDTIDLPQFSAFLRVPKLKSLSISKSRIDLSVILMEIAQTIESVRTMYVTGGRLYTQISSDFCLSESIVYLSITRTAVYPEALGSLLRALLTKPRRKSLALNLGDLGSACSAEETIQWLSVPDAKPVLTELNYSGNELSPVNMPAFLNLLNQQTNLRYLIVSRCFKKEVDRCLDMLAGYITGSNLQGLELVSDSASPLKGKITRFIGSIVGKSQLEALVIDKSAAGDEGLDVLCRYCDCNPKLQSISCDGIAASSWDRLCRAYERFSRLERVAHPSSDVAFFMTVRGTVRSAWPEELSGKKGPKNLTERLADYDLFDLNASNKPMDVMMKLLDMLTDGVKNPEGDNRVLGTDDITGALIQSVATSAVDLGAVPGQNEMILSLVNTDAVRSGEFISEYNTLHNFASVVWV